MVNNDQHMDNGPISLRVNVSTEGAGVYYFKIPYWDTTTQPLLSSLLYLDHQSVRLWVQRLKYYSRVLVSTTLVVQRGECADRDSSG